MNAFAKTYELKELEWKTVDADPETYEVYIDAYTVFCNLKITKGVEDDPEAASQGYGEKFVFEYCVDEYYDEGRENYDTLEEAKAAAEKWYLDRIMPALSLAKDGQ